MGRSYLADIPGNFAVVPIGSNAAVASDGAAAVFAEGRFVAPGNLKILSIWRQLANNEVTAATNSYRQIVAYNGTRSLGTYAATVSKAQYGTVGFTLAATPTVAAGGIVSFSHSTVGGDHNDGTALSAAVFQIAYELL